jgi:hypothetical protein
VRQAEQKEDNGVPEITFGMSLDSMDIVVADVDEFWYGKPHPISVLSYARFFLWSCIHRFF